MKRIFPARVSSLVRTITLFFLVAISIACNNASTNPNPAPPSSASTPLTIADVQQVIQDAAQSVNVPLVISVVDRAGNILAVFQTPGAPTTAIGNFGATVDSNDLAIALARTAALFSNDQAPLSSRTIRFISGTHYPRGWRMLQMPTCTESKTPIAGARSIRHSTPG